MGAIGHDGLAIPGRVELAHELPFALGDLRVEPPTRQVWRGNSRETLEPRVMQVLVALARHPRVVTRDELILWCWDGRVVGDDAINRVIARIRQIAAGIGEDGFAVETIPRVGFLLSVRTGDSRREDAAPSDAPTTRPAVSRRTVIAGAAATAAVTAIAGAAWLKPWAHRPADEAVELLRRAEIAWKSGLDDQSRESIQHLERAVRIDPQYADAWGALAVAYTHFLEGFGEAEMASIPGRIRAAAARALELDPGNGNALLALACIKPNFRNWATMEAELRAISEDHPDLWLAHGRLAFVLYQVGRFEEGVRLHRRVLEIDPMIPVPYVAIARALASRGEIQAAEAALDEARDKWPVHPMIWYARFFHLLFAGRPQAAAATVLNPDERPSGMPAERIEAMVRIATAVDKRRDADVAFVVDDFRRTAETDVGFTPMAAQFFSLFGMADLTFASLDRYFLNRDGFGPPAAIGPYTRRNTDFLFSQPLAASRADPRFGRLLEETGLTRYWRSAGVLPDYRRT